MSKICIITGGNSGIGLATAREMAKMGYHLILACRSEERTKPVIEELIKTTGNSNIEFMKLDLSSLKSVREFVSQFKEKNLPLHVLINNAGCQGLYGLTEDGLEIVLASNHFGHFLLTNLLLDKLYETYKQTGEPSRIVIVASDAYKFVDRFDFNDIEGKKIEGKYFGMQTYGRSKLANILFGIELNKRLNSEKFSGILVNMMHPGAVATNLGRNAPRGLGWIASIVNLFFRSPEKGAETVVWLATTNEIKDMTGQYFKDKQIQPLKPSANNPEDAKKLWEISVQLTGLNENNIEKILSENKKEENKI